MRRLCLPYKETKLQALLLCLVSQVSRDTRRLVSQVSRHTRRPVSLETRDTSVLCLVLKTMICGPH